MFGDRLAPPLGSVERQALQPIDTDTSGVVRQGLGERILFTSLFCFEGEKNPQHCQHGMAPPRSQSQFHQDVLALHYNNQKKDGYYVEIGVHDGEIQNNTALLDHMGWSGVCIDPFQTNMAKRTCTRAAVALGDREGVVDFRALGHEIGGVEEFVSSSVHNSKWHKSMPRFEVSQVKMRTPAAVLRDALVPPVIDYLSLDVEGSEMSILRAFPHDRYCVRFSTVETNMDRSKEREVIDFMTSKGYTHAGSIGTDQLFARDCPPRAAEPG